jgi:VCBS repeat-containing protein
VVVNASTGAFTYTPTVTARHAAARNGAVAGDKADTFTVTIVDGYGGTATAVVNVTVSPSNANPVAGTPVVGTPNATTGVVTGTVTATDGNGDTLTYSGSTTTSKGAVVVNASTGAFTYTPTVTARQNAAQSGATAADQAETFTVTVTDGYGGSTSIPVEVVISPLVVTRIAAGLPYMDQGSVVPTDVLEGDTGTTNVSLPVTLSGASSQTVTVSYTVATAYNVVAGVDFLATSGTVVFAPGETRATIPITIYGDTRYESSGAIQIRLTGATNAVLVADGAGDSATYSFLTIRNDDAITG